MAGSITDARQLHTKRAVARVHLGRASSRVLLAGFVAAVALRVSAGPLGLADLAVVLFTAVAAPFFEWFAHRDLLHRPAGRAGDAAPLTGRAHARHHEAPAEIDHVLLGGLGAVLFATAAVAVVAVGVVPVAVVIGAPVLAPLATGVAAAFAKLNEYEWVHLLFHTSYRCRSRRYAQLERNHRRHHWRDDTRWLGVTTSLADRVLDTAGPDAWPARTPVR